MISHRMLSLAVRSKFGIVRHSSKAVFDFRSDTTTKPTKGMMEAMANAEVGDDVYEEDATVKALEQHMAKLCGKESALFCVTGTMANQLGIRAQVGAMQSVFCDAKSHIYRYEVGGIAYHSQAHAIPIKPSEGRLHMTTADVDAEIEPFDIHTCVPAMVCVEQSLSNGTCFPIDDLRQMRQMATRHQMRVHMDGARLLNAHIATGVTLEEYGQCVDSIAICLSKGLGAPIGSVLVGTSAMIERARHFRKLLGGGWRQAGVLAGAALYAVQNHLHGGWALAEGESLQSHNKGIAQDHLNAKKLANGLVQLGYEIEFPVQTNMVFVKDPKRTLPPLNKLAPLLAKQGFVIPGDAGTCRLVTHLQTPDHAVEDMLRIIKSNVAS